jgi:hypothetical protein
VLRNHKNRKRLVSLDFFLNFWIKPKVEKYFLEFFTQLLLIDFKGVREIAPLSWFFWVKPKEQKYFWVRFQKVRETENYQLQLLGCGLLVS